ncbi:hypothetical protein Glove_714g22 [Diversispora epigaea]|uniref:Uncharacterized protein n=1 Tax=Diversispora epigaea TaxID=1348612 RepID=A0A397G0V8_9GLOM|nr:hypothetical protein Glove_714g22 [Diversispora epigaea]
MVVLFSLNQENNSFVSNDQENKNLDSSQIESENSNSGQKNERLKFLFKLVHKIFKIFFKIVIQQVFKIIILKVLLEGFSILQETRSLIFEPLSDKLNYNCYLQRTFLSLHPYTTLRLDGVRGNPTQPEFTAPGYTPME